MKKQWKDNKIYGDIKMRLYEIEEAYRIWQEKIELQEGELTEEDFAELERLNVLAEDKIEGYSVIIKESLAEAEILKQEADKLITRANSKKKLAERLKGNLDLFMQSQGREKFASLKTQISYRPSVVLEISEGAKIPKKWLKVKTEIDKSAIKDFIKNGGKVNGCMLVNKQNIQIK
jgi:hypothetical protein